MASQDRERILERLDKRAFYEAYGLELKPAGVDGFVARCPFHEDTNPSLSISIDTGLWDCKVGCGGGSVFDFYMRKENVPFIESLKALARQAGVELERPERKKTAASRPPIPETIVRLQHDRLMKNEEQLRFLREIRGLHAPILEKYQIGHDGDRFWIPIRDHQGKLANIRKYKPGAKNFKMLSHQVKLKSGDEFAYGEARLWPAVAPEGDYVLLTEGEMDRMVAEQHGFPAVTHTGGAGTWKVVWNDAFKDKHVVIAYDRDEHGKKGAMKVARSILKSKVARSIKILAWPGHMSDPNTDVTDWFVQMAEGVEAFQALIDAAVVFEDVPDFIEEESVDVDLTEAAHSENVGRRISVEVMVAGKITSPYQVPGKVRAWCDQGAKKLCEGCGMNSEHHGNADLTFTDRDREVMSLFQCSDFQQKGAIADALGLGGRRCNRWRHEVVESMNVERVSVIPVVENRLKQTGEKKNEYVTRTLYVMGKNINVRTQAVYKATGYAYPQPNDQRATVLVGKMEPVELSLDNFVLTDNQIESMRKFQTSANQSAYEKMYEIATEMEKVHRIWGRRDLQIAYDLSWHSALSFHLFGQFQPKGYAELFVIGDSAQGKSQIAEALCNHYRAGQMVQAEQSSAAGLIGGLTKRDDRFEVSWGPVVLADRQLLVLDETQGMKEEDAERLTNVRSSGRAQIVKIERQEANARTRLIFLANPNAGRQLVTYDCGAEAIYPGIFRKAEDARRIDFAIAVASGEVSDEVINSSRTTEECPYTSDECSALVMWAWSRKAREIVFEDGVEDMIRQRTLEFGKKYSSRIPLLEPADARWKIARLTVGCSTRLFSTTDGKIVRVTRDHVDFVTWFMDKVYSSRAMGYDRFSARHKMAETYVQTNHDKIFIELEGMVKQLMPEVLRLLMAERYMRVSDIGAQLDLDKKIVQQIIRHLTKHQCIESTTGGFRKKPAFVEALRYIEDHGMPSSNGNGHHQEDLGFNPSQALPGETPASEETVM